MDAEHVVVHDPYFGPDHRIPYGELLELWQPKYPNSEIVGNMLIGVAVPAPERAEVPGLFRRDPGRSRLPEVRRESTALSRGAPRLRRRVVPASSLELRLLPLLRLHLDLRHRAPRRGEGARGGDLEPRPPLRGARQARGARPREQGGRPTGRTSRISSPRSGRTGRSCGSPSRRRWRCAPGPTSELKEFTTGVAKEEEAIAKAQEAAAKPAGPIDAGKLGDALLKDLGIVKDR